MRKYAALFLVALLTWLPVLSSADEALLIWDGPLQANPVQYDQALHEWTFNGHRFGDDGRIIIAGQGMGPGPGISRAAGGGGCGAGTFAHIQDVGDTSVGGGTSFALPSWTVVAGHVVTMYATWDATGGLTMSITESLGNTFTPTTAGRRGPSSNGQYIQAFTSTIANSGTGFITLVPSGNIGSLGGFASEFSLSSGIMAVDQEAYNAPGGASTTPTSGALTPACNNSMAFGFMESCGVGTVGAGWTSVGTSVFISAEYQVQTTAASLNANWTQSSCIYGAGMIVVKPQ